MTPERRSDVRVFDDEPTITDVVCRYLARAGYATRAAADGSAAVAIVEAHGGRIWLEPADAGTRVRFSLLALP